MIDEKNLQIHLSKSDLYQFLSFSLHQPSLDVIEGYLDGSIAEDILNILEELAFSQQQISRVEKILNQIQSSCETPEDLLHQARREYSRLFIHPDKPIIGIYETMILFVEKEGVKKPPLFISPAALSAERYYKNAGLHTTGYSQEPPDFIPTELEFMMFVHQQLAKAIDEENLGAQTKWQELLDGFSQEHLKKWAVGFFSACQINSENPIFGVVGAVGKMFMDQIFV